MIKQLKSFHFKILNIQKFLSARSVNLYHAYYEYVVSQIWFELIQNYTYCKQNILLSAQTTLFHHIKPHNICGDAKNPIRKPIVLEIMWLTSSSVHWSSTPPMQHQINWTASESPLILRWQVRSCTMPACVLLRLSLHHTTEWSSRPGE